jgi:hypothetical protein
VPRREMTWPIQMMVKARMPAGRFCWFIARSLCRILQRRQGGIVAQAGGFVNVVFGMAR